VTVERPGAVIVYLLAAIGLLLIAGLCGLVWAWA
jgi:hypothetical protein